MKFSSALSCMLSAASMVAALPLDRRQFSFGAGGSTVNDIKNGKCAPVTFIFARGSTEPGNMGMSVGPGVAKNLKSMLGNVAIQGVDYTATMASNMGGGRAGGQAMAADVKLAKQKCPNTKIAVGGYSQGGMVVHQALKSVGSDVSAAVLYGDPFQRMTISGTPNKKFCAPTDGVCKTGGFAITAGHMSYMTNGDTKAGAEFIVQNTKGGAGSSSSSSSSSDDDSSDDPSSSSDGSLASLMGGSASSSGSRFGSLLGGGSSDDSSAADDSSTSDSSDSASDDSSSASDSSSADPSSGGLSSLIGGGSSGSDDSSASSDDSSAAADDPSSTDSSSGGGLAGLMGTASKLGKLAKLGSTLSGMMSKSERRTVVNA